MTTALDRNGPILFDAAAGSHPGLEQRLEVICSALRISRPEGVDRYERMIDALRDSLPSEQAAYILFQWFLARIATKQEIQDLQRRWKEDSDSLRRSFMESPEYRCGSQASTRMDLPAQTSLLIDVSQTLADPHNTGIQRVVRCTAEQMARLGLDQRLIGFDPRLNNYCYLDTAKVDLLFDWEQPRNYSSCNLNERLSPLKKLLRKLVGPQVTELVRTFSRAWRDAWRERKQQRSNQKTLKSAVESSNCLFIWDHRLLIPEVIGDQYRLDRLSSLLANTPASASLILYDFIPLQYPEFCKSQEVFVQYLTLLRYVDRISCISRTVEAEARQILSMTPRFRSPPQIETHYLGGDFDFRREADAPEEEMSLPLILCVGSIEERKNQRRIMRAMVSAQERGCKFRGVFVGKLGTKHEVFLKEVADFQARGFEIEVRHTAGEAELQQLYGRSRFTLFCSLAEGFGLPIIESIFKGIPCIVSDRGSMREIAQSIGGCLLVDPESEASITEAVVTLFCDGPRLEALRRDARGASWPSWCDYARTLYQFAGSDAPLPALERSVA